MQKPDKHQGFKPQENLISILPSIVAGIFVLSASIATVLIYFPPLNPFYKIAIIFYWVFGGLYLTFYYFLFTASLNKSRFSWINSIISGVALGEMVFLIPVEIDPLLYILVIIASISASIISTRGPSYFLVISASVIYLVRHLNDHIPNYQWVIHIGFIIAALMAIETIQQLKKIAREQINRLEIINELSKQIVSTLDTKQVFSLLNAAFQNAFEADSYYIGIMHGDEIHLELFYDDGEYFPDIHLNKHGTLSNWVITHQQDLFLPDLRQGLQLDNVDIITIGKKEKTTLSWMGVPMRSSHINGMMAISSYHPNAFDRSDMELLSTIAQRAALALDNTHHHALVEEQTRLDSLTRVYNHGYFIQNLHAQSKSCREQNQPLSLIMLDIDHFKQYNDTFGHLIGDEILVSLCDVIRSHIKNTDAVGRWGGEEFSISLPNSNKEQAMRVAQRIRETMAFLKLRNNEQMTIPVPTVSQGIAFFPIDTDDITKLIDIADKRLYMAKKRGRDQIEPAHEIKNIEQ